MGSKVQCPCYWFKIFNCLRIKSYNVLNYNNCSTDWNFPLSSHCYWDSVSNNKSCGSYIILKRTLIRHLLEEKRVIENLFWCWRYIIFYQRMSISNSYYNDSYSFCGCRKLFSVAGKNKVVNTTGCTCILYIKCFLYVNIDVNCNIRETFVLVQSFKSSFPLIISITKHSKKSLKIPKG